MKGVKKMGYIVAVFMMIVGEALDWLVACGIIKLITVCFSWNFSWLVATGIWLVSLFVRSWMKR